MTQQDRSIDALSRARLAVACAELGHEQHVDVFGSVRPVVEELIDEGALERAVLLIERDDPSACLAVTPRRATGAPRVTEVLEEDHRRLDALAARALEVATRDAKLARDLARAFDAGLRRHFRIEEELLFPTIEVRAPRAARATTERMRLEHRAVALYLTRLLAAVDRLFDAPASALPRAHEELARAHYGLASVLAEHNDKEERALFPVLDAGTDDPTRAALVRRVLLF